jgi:hypothetical protein
MTLIQINEMLECAAIREHNEYAAQAALHGHKIKTKSFSVLNSWKTTQKQQKQKDIDYDKMHSDMDKMMQDIQNG